MTKRKSRKRPLLGVTTTPDLYPLQFGAPSNPINLAIPNTVESKMTAISRLSEAVVELARALNSTNVNCTISNNLITTTAGGTGINVDTK